MTEKRISIKGTDQLLLLGSGDVHLRRIENAFNAKIVVRGDEIYLNGDDAEVRALEYLFVELIWLLNRHGRLDSMDIETAIDMASVESHKEVQTENNESRVVYYGRKQPIRAKTKGQELYFSQVEKNDIVFAIGPAGTGKTYLAVAFALAALKEQEVNRIILTRPAIEAGESLGFLPGDLMEKVDPYLRPLTDALFDMLPAEQLQRYLEKKVVEIVPLAYMRGRTLNNAYVILDEAQNTSSMQMKMFLTRLGIHSKAIITGDITQTDLPDNRVSGLVQIQDILKGIEGIGFVYLENNDIVRHRLIKEIIKAYDGFHASKESGAGE